MWTKGQNMKKKRLFKIYLCLWTRHQLVLLRFISPGSRVREGLNKEDALDHRLFVNFYRVDVPMEAPSAPPHTHVHLPSLGLGVCVQQHRRD